MVDVAELLRMTADAMASVKMPSGERGGLEPLTPRFKSHVLDRERISRAAPPSRSREAALRPGGPARKILWRSARLLLLW